MLIIPIKEDFIHPFVFVTGGSGYIGRRLVESLGALGFDVRCLTRQAAPSPAGGRVRFVHGDLNEPETYAEALRGASLVFHLAAQTGKAPAAAYLHSNVRGTEAIVAASRRAGVRRLVHVSSIAAGYPHTGAYHYAESKSRGEDVVRQGGVPYVIARPTLVFGRGSPTWQGLAALAGLPVAIVFGDGRNRVQPIGLDDLVSALIAIADDDALVGQTIDLGGPDILTMQDLLGRIRRALGRTERPTVHVPVALTIRLLNACERLLYPVLPFTAGQFSVFACDSTAHENPRKSTPRPMIGIDEMIALSASRAE